MSWSPEGRLSFPPGCQCLSLTSLSKDSRGHTQAAFPEHTSLHAQLRGHTLHFPPKTASNAQGLQIDRGPGSPKAGHGRASGDGVLNQGDCLQQMCDSVSSKGRGCSSHLLGRGRGTAQHRQCPGQLSLGNDPVRCPQLEAEMKKLCPGMTCPEWTPQVILLASLRLKRENGGPG